MRNFNLCIVGLFLLFSFFTKTIICQNVVQTSDFETNAPQLSTCNLVAGYLPTPWLQSLSCDYYIKGTGPYSQCFPHSGIDMAGFAATNANGVSSIPYREYVIQSINLMGGTTYKVEFWIKRDGGNGTDIKIGGQIGTANYACSGTPSQCPLIPIAAPTVSGIIAGNNQQWTKIMGCYTPSSSGTYYLTIGNFQLTTVEGTEENYFLLDDVSVTPITGIGNPSPILTINGNAFCDGQPIIANGSTSTNVDWYRWELWTQSGTLKKSGSITDGNPGTLNVNNFYSLVEGECYRLKLVTFEECVQEVVFKDFCIENPNVQLSLTGTNPYCEGDNITITATGDNGWTYVWTTGQSGVGLKNINVTTNTSTTQYSVTVTTGANCTATQSVNLTVHPNNNVAPTTGGINNTGEFTYYINAPKLPTNNSFSFYIPTYDASNENVTISVNQASLPNNTTFNGDGLFHETGTFTWLPQGPAIPDIGVHTFTIDVTDNNACNPITVPYTFKINVACENCPLDVYYQDRHPNNKPLPAVTVAGRKIVAGYNVDTSQPLGTVETGNASVLFEAPEVIEMVAGFTGGPNYTAQINPTACTNDCDICCNSFTGFTHGTIPNVFTPNGDLINDVWYVPDFSHPNCAFNAKHFHLEIFRPWGNVKVWDLSDANLLDRCCFFSSPSSSCVPNCEYPYSHSDIYWDGKINYQTWWLPVGSYAPDGTYFYVLTLLGCGQSQSFTGTITLFDGSAARMASNDTLPSLNSYMMNDAENLSGLVTANEDVSLITNKQLLVYPNPTKEKLYVKLSDDSFISGNVAIYTIQSKLLHLQPISGKQSFLNVTNLVAGTYFIKLTNNGETYNQIFVKE